MKFEKLYNNVSEGEMKAVALKILMLHPEIKLIYLYGTLGSGKTTMAKALIEQITGRTDVTSPTYNIVQSYDGKEQIVYHYDFYRLQNPSELHEIGILENLTNGWNIIEWPEIADEFLTYEKKITVSININKHNLRDIIIESR